MSEGYTGLPAYYLQSSDPITPNLLLSLKGMDPIVAEDFVKIDTFAAGPFGSTLDVNGVPVASPNFVNSATVVFSVVGSNVSATAVAGGVGTVTSVGTSGLATGGPIVSAGTINVAGSGSTLVAATAAASIATAPSGDLITSDGLGNVQDSGTLLSALALKTQLPQTFAAVAGEFINSYNATTGLFTASAAGTGTVTSVSFTGGLISVATPTTTPALTVAGTSGGIPYFNSATTWASSAVLASTGLVIGGGAGTAPLTDTQLTWATASATLTVGLAGTSSGVLSLTGSTSGNATITAPAVAGTATNPVVFSNSITTNHAILAVTGTFTGASSITLGSAGINSGVITLEGSTSGSCTITAPAVAGTTSNAITFSNAITTASTVQGSKGIFSGIAGVQLGSAGTASGLITFEGSTSGSCTITAPAVASTVTNALVSSNSFNLSGTGAVYQAQGTSGVTQTAEAVGTLATIGGIVTTFTAVSDERLKIFVPYEGGLDALLSIVPIRYRWNEKGQKISGQKGDRDYIGFSADNVQKSIPESIQSKKGPEGYLSFDDRPVIAALVNAVKELLARIEVLEARK